MPSLESLLKAVIDSPDDDFPRLTYADAEERNGNGERAEFIRVQCALEKLAPTAADRPALEHREKDLLDQFGWDWAEEFGHQISEWAFRRGFIERVHMGLEKSAARILEVLHRAPIRHLRDDSQMGELDGFIEALPQVRHLQGLEFWALYVVKNSQVKEMLASPQLSELRTLILHCDRNGNPISDKVLIEALNSPQVKHVEELAVNVDGMGCGPSRSVLKAIAESAYLKNLRKLMLSNAGDQGNAPKMDVKTARCLGVSTNFAMLEELDLGMSSFSNKVWDEVLKWPWLSNLRWLRLYNARHVDPKSRMTVAMLEDLPVYRDELNRRAAVVDWHSECNDPWVGGNCWHGLSWKSRKQRLLFGMDRFIRAREYDGLEAEYRRLSQQLSGDEVTAKIDGLSFDAYVKEIDKQLRKALAHCSQGQGQCLVLHVRLDMEWTTSVDAYPDDPHLHEPSESATFGVPLDDLPNIRFLDAARCHDRYPIYATIRPSGSALYVLARTIATFGRCLDQYSDLPSIYLRCGEYAVFRMPTETKS